MIRTEILGALFGRPEMDRPQTSTIPIDKLTRARTLYMDHHPNVLLAGGVGDERESRHFGLHDDTVAAVQANQDPFCDAFDCNDRPATGSFGEGVCIRCSLNRPIRNLGKLDVLDNASDERQKTAPHGFDFG